MTDLLQPFVPTAADPFDLRKAGHLLRRAGWSGSLRQRSELVRGGVAAAVESVMPAAAAPPSEQLLQEAIAFGDIEHVRSHRVHVCLQGDHPLRERMSSMWHDHFATSNKKVLDARSMALQQAMFDRLGLDTFDNLLLAVSRDPAMLRWLDNDTNRKGHPNENFARELFELFALGRGCYSERDVAEAARAFTGWHVIDGQFHFLAAYHDAGDKEVFGQRSAFGGEQIVAMTAARPESARWIAERLLRFFVHPQPTAEEVEALARCYTQNERHLGRTVHTLLASRLFFSARAWRSKQKSPAEFVLGLVRLLGARAAPSELARAMGAMGELWLEPPTVEGWPRDTAWLNPASWLLRANFAADLLAGRRGKLRPAADDLFAAGGKPSERVAAAVDLLLDGDVSAASRTRLVAFAAKLAADGPGGAAALLHATACTPEFQLL